MLMSTLIAEPASGRQVEAEEQPEAPYAIVADPALTSQLMATRQQAGSDRWDDVWDGASMLVPLPNDEHQGLVQRLETILDIPIGKTRLGVVRPGVNESDRIEGWKENYRCPDVVAFLRDARSES